MDTYSELLDATIEHLQTLKRRGVRYLQLDQETKALLNEPLSPARRPAVAAAQPQPKAVPAPAPRAPQPPPAPSRPPVTSPAPPAAPVALHIDKNLSREAAFAELRERALVCQKCSNLASSRKNVVWGVGSIDAELMFVGEAPGADEDVQGEPFVGRAGELLTKMIKAMDLSREAVYIANILKCRPDTPGQSFGNRPPTPKEMENCLPYLHAQIDLIKPKVLVALGATAVDGLFGRTPGVGITKMRGKWREYRGIPVMPTYHPSYLLRPNVNNVKREVWEDMLQVMERLGMLISEKQRGYFLKVG